MHMALISTLKGKLISTSQSTSLLWEDSEITQGLEKLKQGTKQHYRLLL